MREPRFWITDHFSGSFADPPANFKILATLRGWGGYRTPPLSHLYRIT